MTINNNIQPAIWIHRTREVEGDTDYVKSILPERYDFYFKLFFPLIFEHEETGQTKKVAYQELAALAKKPFDADFSLPGIPSFLMPFIATSSVEDYKVLEKLITILGPETATIFHGVGEENVPKEFADPWIITGTMAEFPQVVGALNGNTRIELVHFPNYIFPLDKSWCLGNLIPKSGLFLLGCDAVVAEQLRAQEEIEVVELSAESRYYELMD